MSRIKNWLKKIFDPIFQSLFCHEIDYLKEAEENYDDMLDGNPGNIQKFSPIIQKKLKKYRNTTMDKNLYTIYLEANKKAICYQECRKGITTLFLFTTACGVILAICQEFFGSLIKGIIGFNPLLFGEIFFVIVAIMLLIFHKFILNYNSLWLVERHKAERCRFLKYKDLLWPDKEYDEFDEDLNKIDSISIMNMNEINRWILCEGVCPNRGIEEIFDMQDKNETVSNDYKDIIKYYICRRLLLQISYYKKKYEDNKKPKKFFVKYLLTITTLLALIFAIMHIIISLLGMNIINEFEGGIRIAVTTLFVIAILPVLSSTLQTFINARQFQNLANNYLKYFSLLSRYLINDLANQKNDKSIEDFLNDEYLERKKRKYPWKKTEFLSNKKEQYGFLISMLKSCNQESTESEITLEKILRSTEENPMKAFRILFECEDAMEQEHQFWYSFMGEAEWT